MTSGNAGDDGRGFLRDMAAQSARAHDFDRRLRWSRLRNRLRTDIGPDVEGHLAGSAPDEAVDLRGDREVAAPPATTSAAPAVPRPRHRKPGPGQQPGR